MPMKKYKAEQIGRFFCLIGYGMPAK